MGRVSRLGALPLPAKASRCPAPSPGPRPVGSTGEPATLTAAGRHPAHLRPGQRRRGWQHARPDPQPPTGGTLPAPAFAILQSGRLLPLVAGASPGAAVPLQSRSEAPRRRSRTSFAIAGAVRQPSPQHTAPLRRLPNANIPRCFRKSRVNPAVTVKDRFSPVVDATSEPG